MDNNISRAFFQIPGALLFHLTGRDAARYLHARVSNNIRDLGTMRGCAAAALSPQGRTEAFGTALKISGEEFYFICDGGASAEVTAALLRYKVADRLDCSQLSEHSLLHVTSLEALTEILPECAALKENAEYSPLKAGALVAFKHQRTVSIGADVFGPAGEIEKLINQLNSSAVQLNESQQRVGRIRARRPAFPGELNDQGIFLESGLSHAVSFTKGCYVGQEVMEKVDSHGRLPFSLVSLLSTASGTVPSMETAISTSSGSAAGEVISAAEDSDKRVLCFARVKSASLQPDTVFIILNQEYRLL